MELRTFATHKQFGFHHNYWKNRIVPKLPHDVCDRWDIIYTWDSESPVGYGCAIAYDGVTFYVQHVANYNYSGVFSFLEGHWQSIDLDDYQQQLLTQSVIYTDKEYAEYSKYTKLFDFARALVEGKYFETEPPLQSEA